MGYCWLSSVEPDSLHRIAEGIYPGTAKKGKYESAQKPASYKAKKRQREDIEANLSMENRVKDAKGLPVEKLKYNFPVALCYQAEYEAEQDGSYNNDYFKCPS